MTAFETFWSDIDTELAQDPIDAQLEPLPLHSTESSTTYLVRLTSLGGYRIAGYYCVPKAAAAVGLSYEALCQRMIELALNRRSGVARAA